MAAIVATVFVVIALLASLCQASAYSLPFSNATAQTETQQEDIKAAFIRQYAINVSKKQIIQPSGSNPSVLFQPNTTHRQQVTDPQTVPMHGDIRYLHILYLF